MVSILKEPSFVRSLERVELLDCLVGIQEDLLNDFLGLARIPQHSPRNSMNHAAVFIEQRRESVRVAFPDLADEFYIFSVIGIHAPIARHLWGIGRSRLRRDRAIARIVF